MAKAIDCYGQKINVGDYVLYSSSVKDSLESVMSFGIIKTISDTRLTVKNQSGIKILKHSRVVLYPREHVPESVGLESIEQEVLLYEKLNIL